MSKAVAKLRAGDAVRAVVAAVGEERITLTLPDFASVVATASAVDFNLRGQHSANRFKVQLTALRCKPMYLSVPHISVVAADLLLDISRVCGE